MANRGDGDRIANWHPYGAEVLAVANAVVADVKDGLPDNAGGAAGMLWRSRRIPLPAISKLGKWKPPSRVKADRRRRELPAENVVVRFP
jgi:hypothetical protein